MRGSWRSDSTRSRAASGSDAASRAWLAASSCEVETPSAVTTAARRSSVSEPVASARDSAAAHSGFSSARRVVSVDVAAHALSAANEPMCAAVNGRLVIE